MLNIICYDISNDKKREKVAEYLEGYGIRVQKSVFECNVTNKKLKEIIIRLSEYISNEDSIRVYPICENCYLKSTGIGIRKNKPGKKGYAIF